MEQNAILDGDPIGEEIVLEIRREGALLKAGALQNAIFNGANFSGIVTDEKGVIQIFNVGAERILGYMAAEVVNKITPAGKVMAEWLKEVYPDIKILFTSGYTDDALSQHGLLEPGIAFLPKPYTPAALMRKARELPDDKNGGKIPA